MKRYSNLLATLLLVASINSAQADSSYITYQGVAFNSGAAVSSTPISLRFTILQSDGSTVVYQETQTGVTTSDKGYFSHQIGSGTRTDGAATYSAISWSDGYKLKVEVDYSNGSSYTNLGIQELTSSVYTIKAKTADSATSIAGLTSTVTELNYVDGVASNIQTQLNGKESTISGGASTITSSNLTTNRALISNASGKVAVASVTSTELGYVDGVTSNIQTQLNNKLSLSGGTITGTLNMQADIYHRSGDVHKLTGSGTTSAGYDFYGWGIDGTFQVSNDTNPTAQAVSFEVTDTKAIFRYPVEIDSDSLSKTISGYSYLYYDPAITGRTTSTFTKTFSLYASSRIAADSFTAFSDKRIKTDIKPISNAIDMIQKLKPSSYTMIDKVKEGNSMHYGFIAQEVEEVMPNVISKGKGEIPVLKKQDEVTFEDGVEYTLLIKNSDGIQEKSYKKGEILPSGEIVVLYKKVDDFRTVDYNMIFTQAVAAIQEQQTIIESQQKEIDNIKSELKQIKEALKASGLELK